MSGESDDAFLGGRIHVLQPVKGYRAGTDAVLLSAAVGAREGDTVLDLGCGTGVVLLCLGARIPRLILTGVERRASHAALARRNFARNGLMAEIIEADIRELPPGLKERAFDHVVSNPPYHDRRHGKSGGDAGREEAIAADLPFADWARVAMRRVRPKGRLTMIAPAERLPDLLNALGGRGVTVLPVASRKGRDPGRAIVSAIKGGRSPFRLLTSFVVHEGLARLDDGDDFTGYMRAILRDGASLSATLD